MICTQCPRKCGMERPESASGRENLPGFCHSPLKPVLARAGLHHWEEPAVSGTRGSGTVFFSGCNLHCVFCQNYRISTLNRGTEISVERLREIYRELIAAGAHNINLVTPTHCADAIFKSLDTPLPVPVVWNSNGYDDVETLRRFEGKIQVFLPDLKYADDKLGQKYSGVSDYFDVARKAIDEMFRQTGPFETDEEGVLRKGVLIRHLILPGAEQNTLAVIRHIAERFAPGEVLFSLMRQYLPCGKVSEHQYPELNRKVSDEEYARVEKALFDSGIEDGFVQEESSAVEDFIPLFDGSGVISASNS